MLWTSLSFQALMLDIIPHPPVRDLLHLPIVSPVVLGELCNGLNDDEKE